VSFDDGDHWQPLRLNMPATSIRDLVVKDDDRRSRRTARRSGSSTTSSRCGSSTDAPPARSVQAAGARWRVRWNKNTDTPLPQEEPAGRTRPTGAIVDYWLARDADVPVVLEIRDQEGGLVRRYASDDQAPEPIAGRNIPTTGSGPGARCPRARACTA
jgi:hypothetical protein